MSMLTRFRCLTKIPTCAFKKSIVFERRLPDLLGVGNKKSFCLASSFLSKNVTVFVEPNMQQPNLVTSLNCEINFCKNLVAAVNDSDKVAEILGEHLFMEKSKAFGLWFGLNNSLNDTKHQLVDTKHQLESYKQLRYLNFLRAEIDRWEIKYSIINAEIDYKKAKKLQNTIDQAMEIRRQRWHHILTNETDHVSVNELLKRMKKANISVDEFARKIAEGYDYLSTSIKNVIYSPGMNRFISTQDRSVKDCLDILTADIDFRVGEAVKESVGIDSK